LCDFLLVTTPLGEPKRSPGPLIYLRGPLYSTGNRKGQKGKIRKREKRGKGKEKDGGKGRKEKGRRIKVGASGFSYRRETGLQLSANFDTLEKF